MLASLGFLAGFIGVPVCAVLAGRGRAGAVSVGAVFLGTSWSALAQYLSEGAAAAHSGLQGELAVALGASAILHAIWVAPWAGWAAWRRRARPLPEAHHPAVRG